MEQLLGLSEPQFPHPQSGNDKTEKELWLFDEVVYLSDLAQYVTLSGYSPNVSQHPFNLYYYILSYVALCRIIPCVRFQGTEESALQFIYVGFPAALHSALC